jgi:hypothetical protein
MKRPKLIRISEEMRRMCVMLGDEMLRFGLRVRAHPMFGMQAFYRGKIVFAMLPDKRAFENADSIMYKLASGAEKSEGKKWKLFKLGAVENLSSALEILDKAYNKAKSSTRKK